MNLRELVNKSATLKDLEILVEHPFDFDKDDVPVLNVIGESHRTKRIATKSTFDAQYDYSPEARVFLSFLYHRLLQRGFPVQSLRKLKEQMKVTEEGYLLAPNHQFSEKPRDSDKTYGEAKRQLVREMFLGERGTLYHKVVKETQKHFYAVEKQCWGNRHPEKGAVNFLKAFHAYSYALDVDVSAVDLCRVSHSS